MKLDNQGLDVFSSCCPSLTDLTLSLCLCIDDSGLGFNTLHAITSSGIFSVAVGCKSLPALHLISCKKVGSVECLEYHGSLGSLEELVVKCCKRISQYDLLKFGQGWMKLQKFEFHPKNWLYGFDPYDPLYMADYQYRHDFCCESLKDLTLARIVTEPEIGLRCLLRKCKALEDLCLYQILGLNDNDMITLTHNCSNLRSISLWIQHLDNEIPEGRVFSTPLTDNSLKALALRCPMLEAVELIFSGCSPIWPSEIGFTQEGLVTLIQSCPIRDLVLSGANCFNDEGMKALSSAQYLETLKLMDCVAITDAGMRLLARTPRLINLTLRQCDGFSDDGVGEVVRARKLETLIVEAYSRVSLKAVQGAAKSVNYNDGNPALLGLGKV